MVTHAFLSVLHSSQFERPGGFYRDVIGTLWIKHRFDLLDKTQTLWLSSREGTPLKLVFSISKWLQHADPPWIKQKKYIIVYY